VCVYYVFVCVCRDLLALHIPPTLKKLLGKSYCEKGLLKLFRFFQFEPLVKHMVCCVRVCVCCVCLCVVLLNRVCVLCV